MKFLITQSSPFSRRFLSVMSKLASRNTVLKHRESITFFVFRDQVSH